MFFKRIVFGILIFVTTVNLMAISQIKIICDKDDESVYLNGKFKSECNKDEVVRLMVKEGRYSVVIKKRDKEARYKYEKSFRIGDGVQKVIEPQVKAIYNEYHYYQNALKQESLEACNEYLKNYPNGKYKKAINEIKRYLLAKKDFSYYKVYKQNYPNGKYLQKLKKYYMAHPLIDVLKGHKKYINALVLTKDNNILYSASSDETIKKWDFKNYKLLKTFSYPKKIGGALAVTTIVLSGDERYLYSDGRSRFRKWDVKTGKQDIIADYYPEKILMLDNNRAVTCRGDRVDIWDLNSKKKIYSYLPNGGYDANLYDCTLSKDKRYLYFGQYDSKIKKNEVVKIDIQNKKVARKYPENFEGSIRSIAAYNGKIYAGTKKGKIIIFDEKSGRVLNTLNHEGYVLTIAINPKKEQIATGSSKDGVKIWDIKTGLLLKHIPTYTSVNALTFTKDGKKLIGALDSGDIDVWYVGFYNKRNLLSSFLQECKNGDIFACNNYLRNGGKRIQVAKNEVLKKFKSILQSYNSDIVYKNPKIYIDNQENSWLYYYSDTQNALYKVESIIKNERKVYVLIDVYFKKSGFTFNAPIYLMQNGNKKNYTKRFPSSYKIKVGTKHIKLIFIYDDFPLQKGYYKIIEKDEFCKGCMNFSNGNIVKIF